jgi:hypothetical protein
MNRRKYFVQIFCGSKPASGCDDHAVFSADRHFYTAGPGFAAPPRVLI